LPDGTSTLAGRSGLANGCQMQSLEDGYCEKGSARWDELFGPDSEDIEEEEVDS
jgi:hypothetical protein